jgi:shikimate dehydrogenase
MSTAVAVTGGPQGAPGAAPEGAPVTGSTRLYAVLGDPITQVQAPTLVNALFARQGVDAVLVPVHVRAAALARVIAGLKQIENLDGMLITVPHKAAAGAFADQLSRTVRLLGCTNAIRRNPDGTWRADNFDGVGFVNGLTNAGQVPAGWRVALLGAGGAGSAIALALLEAGASHVSISDPDSVRLADLHDRLRPHWPSRVSTPASPALQDADLVVNATPVGMRPDDPLPFAPQDLPNGCVVADIIMRPARTALLAAAAALGHPVHPGAAMLHHQVDLYHAFFRLDGRNAGRDDRGTC